MNRPEIIAEIGQNFNGDINLALEMIHKVKDCGADVAKFQVYDAVALFPKEGNPWYDYNCSTELTKDQIYRLAAECEKVGIEFMASVFDLERIDWLEEIGVKRYKTASRSITDLELINKIIATGKETIISLGMWNGDGFPQIQGADLKYLYCVSKYPTPLEDVRLSEVDFNKYAGFSDHTIGVSAHIAAMARGAEIIEKHFTLDQNMYGPDHICSATPEELTQICQFRDDLVLIG